MSMRIVTVTIRINPAEYEDVGEDASDEEVLDLACAMLSGEADIPLKETMVNCGEESLLLFDWDGASW